MTLRDRWAALPGGLRGGVWMLATAAAMSVQSAAVKGLAGSVDSIQTVFVRCALGLVLVLPLMRYQLGAVLRPARIRLHLGRVMAGLLSMVCGFYAYANMPLAEAAALSFTMPLFMLGLAVVALGEPVGWRRVAAAVVGFAGVLIMLRPGAVPVEIAALMALLGAFFHAGSGIFIKKLVASETTGMIMFYFAFIGTLVFAVPAAAVWTAPDAFDWFLLAAVAVLGAVSQFTFILAARAAQMSAIVPIDYSRLVFTAAMGYLVWREIPDGWSVAGAALIAASTCFITLRELELARRAREEAAQSGPC